MNRLAGKDTGCHAKPHVSIKWPHSPLLLTALLCAASVPLVSELRAQCAGRDVLLNQAKLSKSPSTSSAPATTPRIVVRSAADVPVWKTITTGTFPDTFALNGALDTARCAVGDMAREVLARPAFVVSAQKTTVELFAVSAADLGFKTDVVTLANVYARAQELGFGLAPAEIAPQLRLQYLDQPIGEFLIIGIEPIRTWKGDPVILNVANGGAGLILIGQDGKPGAEISVFSRFLFVRSEAVKPADALDQAAALALLPP